MCKTVGKDEGNLLSGPCSQEEVKIPCGEKHIEATIAQPGGEFNNYAVILTHGAGGDKDFSQLVELSNHLSGLGFLCLRFTCKGLNLNYRIKVYKHVLDYLLTSDRYDVKSCFVGGRSMGARAAVGVALSYHGTETEKFISGFVCLSYPLHTKDDHEKLRDEPLLNLKKPVLFVSGSCDEMCNSNLMQKTKAAMTCDTEIHWISGAKHSLNCGKNDKLGVMPEICNAVSEWCCKNISEMEMTGPGGINKMDNTTERRGKRSKDSRSTVKRKKTT